MSRSTTPWAFGLVFISVFAYLAWNNFELPTIFWEETKVTTGKVVDLSLGYSTQGDGYIQSVKYAYSVNGITYYGFKKVGKRFGIQQIGNRVKIQYSGLNPEKRKVEGFYRDFKNSDPDKFHSNEKIGYSEISLVNGIFRFKKFGREGKTVEEFTGEYRVTNDSLIVNSFENNHPIYFFYINFNSGKQLIDSASGMTYQN
ncbi:DUF3592 domain-containing protein [Mangrovibacterium diazotrophicum]|uniref:DUF3592 domain-containing protein n=1 Tax=Mangrovibacterium diazotrophicum TaxID=1261403 RepID=A0A419W9S2_9BACT|nr:DUF3592 domain-containing protein [Mangrovibacterium diazotrophicum]RKD92220.1 hypothetical protein BC643_2590 [Mangrovibacterium diazotrophicum]